MRTEGATLLGMLAGVDCWSGGEAAATAAAATAEVGPLTAAAEVVLGAGAFGADEAAVDVTLEAR